MEREREWREWGGWKRDAHCFKRQRLRGTSGNTQKNMKRTRCCCSVWCGMCPVQREREKEKKKKKKKRQKKQERETKLEGEGRISGRRRRKPSRVCVYKGWLVGWLVVYYYYYYTAVCVWWLVVVVVGKDFLTCLLKPPFKSDLISALFSPHHRWSSLFSFFFKEKKKKHFVQGTKGTSQEKR